MENEWEVGDVNSHTNNSYLDVERRRTLVLFFISFIFFNIIFTAAQNIFFALFSLFVPLLSQKWNQSSEAGNQHCLSSFYSIFNTWKYL